MTTRIMRLAAERALQLASFSNFRLTINGDPITAEVPGHIMEDTTSDYSIPVLSIPVTVSYRDITPDLIDPLAPPEPSVPGRVLVGPSGDAKVEADFARLGALRHQWDTRL